MVGLRLMEWSDLPFGSEFSPAQIELSWLLETAENSGGNWRAFEEAVYERYFKDDLTTEYNNRKKANNTKLSMGAYGLIVSTQDTRLTPLGKQLLSLPGERALYARFAKHILLHLHGTSLVQAVRDMQAGGEKVTLVALRQALQERGVHFPRGGKHPSVLRLWLEKAGVFAGGVWNVDETRLLEVLGVEVEELEALASFSVPQRAFLQALANVGGEGPYTSNQLEKLAAATFGVTFNEKSLAKDVLYPLQKAGFVTLERGTAPGGRGAKPFAVTPTANFSREVLEPLLQQAERWADKVLRRLIRKPLDEILQELNVRDRHVKGMALEALAFKLMRLLDLNYVATRLRGIDTGGAEVDMVFDSARLVFSRWQVQCKNVRDGVRLDDVAKEVGLTHMLKSNVIVIISTGRIGQDARHYANMIMKESNLAIVMIDRNDVERIKRDPPSILDVFRREANRTMRLKALKDG
jgi:hypothetical protein